MLAALFDIRMMVPEVRAVVMTIVEDDHGDGDKEQDG